MRRAIAMLWGFGWRAFLCSGVIALIVLGMNQPRGWDARKAYETQDTALQGRVGVAIVALTMPETYEAAFFEHFIEKILTKAVPWPINIIASRDNGTALIDPTNPRATTEYAPKVLADSWGNTADRDGVAWAEKYRMGEIKFVKPSAKIAFDAGYFLFPKRKGGMPTITAKTLLKARYAMYARLPNGYLPHFSQTKVMGEAALSALRERHNIAAGAVVEAFNPSHMAQSVRAILDAGIDTLVLASVQPIYSDFEELRGSYPQVHAIVEAWQRENPTKKIKIVIAPYMATTPSFDRLWGDVLTKVAPISVAPAQARARVILSLHGLPVSTVKTDSWTPRAKAVSDRLRPILIATMQAKGYKNVEVIQAAESFADKVEDPSNKIVSVAEEFARAKADKVDIAIALPLDFMAENTDTLFTHAAVMFDGQPSFTRYSGPPASTDWSKPYVRRFQNGSTTIIYSGAPGGDAAPLAGLSLADAISTLWK
jgi:hypothetical protein